MVGAGVVGAPVDTLGIETAPVPGTDAHGGGERAFGDEVLLDLPGWDGCLGVYFHGPVLPVSAPVGAGSVAAGAPGAIGAIRIAAGIARAATLVDVRHTALIRDPVVPGESKRACGGTAAAGPNAGRRTAVGDEVLLRQIEVEIRIAALDVVRPFDDADCGERPAGAAGALVLDGGHPVLAVFAPPVERGWLTAGKGRLLGGRLALQRRNAAPGGLLAQVHQLAGRADLLLLVHTHGVLAGERVLPVSLRYFVETVLRAEGALLAALAGQERPFLTLSAVREHAEPFLAIVRLSGNILVSQVFAVGGRRVCHAQPVSEVPAASRCRFAGNGLLRCILFRL